MQNPVESFEFKDCIILLKSTGKKAKSLRKLRDLIAVISNDSIYHHIYQYYRKRDVLEYNNDFAQWAGESLEERSLSEYFSNIDPFSFDSLDDLRKALLNVIDTYLERFPEPRETMPGNEFTFNEAIVLVFPGGLRANNLAEFLLAIKYADLSSLYYHFYEARIRLGGAIDDFSKWIGETLERQELAAKIRNIDLLMHTLDGIREHLVVIVEEEVRKDMEVMPK